MIRFTHVTKSFGDRVVLDDFTAEIPDGGTLVLTGANGSGKSTLVKLALGLLTHDSGTVEGVEGRRRAAVFQEDRLCEQLTPVGNIRLVLDRPVTNDEIAAELRAVGLPEAVWRTPVRRLSGGERRRVCLVRAMMADADVVCLDEPFTGIDRPSLPPVIDDVLRHVASQDVILVTHSPAEAASFSVSYSPVVMVKLGPT